MPLPLPTTLSLSEVLEYISARCGCSAKEAEKAIWKEIAAYRIIPHSSNGKVDPDWRADEQIIAIDWRNSTIRRKSPHVPYTWTGVYLYRSQIDRWLGTTKATRELATANELNAETEAIDKRLSGKGTIAAETKCKEWLIGLMKSGAPKSPKNQYRLEANSKFEVGIRAFDRAWAAAVQESANGEWSAPGRKS